MISYSTQARIAHMGVVEQQRIIRRLERAQLAAARRLRERIRSGEGNAACENYVLAHDQERERLRNYHHTTLRWKARAANLYRGFLKGKSLADIEPTGRNFGELGINSSSLVATFMRKMVDNMDADQSLRAWLADGDKHLNANASAHQAARKPRRASLSDADRRARREAWLNAHSTKD